VTKCLGNREERAAASWRSLSSHASTPRLDARVGLTDLLRNANRYVHYTRGENAKTLRDTSADRGSFRQRSHERADDARAREMRERPNSRVYVTSV